MNSLSTVNCVAVSSARTPEVLETILTTRLELARGSSLKARLAIRLLGPPGAPVVAVLGGISADRRALTMPWEESVGWWQRVLGHPSVRLAQNHRILSFDYLGGHGRSSAPRDHGHRGFPAIGTIDQAKALAHIVKTLDLGPLKGVISASYGGMVGLQFARLYPHLLNRLLVIAAAHRSEPMAVARRYIQKQILELGTGQDNEAEFVSVARALAMTTYRSPDEFRHRFTGKETAQNLRAYLDHKGSCFSRVFDGAAYRLMLDSIDGHELEPEQIRTPLSLVGFDSDELCSTGLLRELAARAANHERLFELHSDFGHDGFLCEAKPMATVIRTFLNGEAQ